MRQDGPSLHPNSDLELSGGSKIAVETLKGLKTFKKTYLGESLFKKDLFGGSRKQIL